MGTACHIHLVQELPWVQWWGQDGETALRGLGQTFGQFFTPVPYMCEVFADIVLFNRMVFGPILQLRSLKPRDRK